MVLYTKQYIMYNALDLACPWQQGNNFTTTKSTFFNPNSNIHTIKQTCFSYH